MKYRVRSKTTVYQALHNLFEDGGAAPSYKKN